MSTPMLDEATIRKRFDEAMKEVGWKMVANYEAGVRDAFGWVLQEPGLEEERARPTRAAAIGNAAQVPGED